MTPSNDPVPTYYLSEDNTGRIDTRLRESELREIGGVQTIYVRWPFSCQVELNEEEMLRLLEKTGHFKMLDGPEEDIYSMDDGEPL